MSGDDDEVVAFFGGVIGDFVCPVVSGVDIGFADVGGIDDGLGGEESEVFDCGPLFFVEIGIAGRLAIFEERHDLFEGFEFRLCVFVGFGIFACAFDAFFDLAEVGENEFEGNDIDISERVYGAVDVGDVVVVKAANHVDDGVDFADVGEELVAEALAFGCAFDEAGNVNELDSGGEDLFGSGNFGEDIKSGIGDADHSDVGFDGAEGKVCGLGLRVGNDGVEEG